MLLVQVTEIQLHLKRIIRKCHVRKYQIEVKQILDNVKLLFTGLYLSMLQINTVLCMIIQYLITLLQHAEI